MATVWLSYAWADNKDNDVDFAAQELIKEGLTVKLDRWDIGAGRRLWEQISDFITNPAQSDAWILYATPNSLASEPCKEEYAYALGRALSKRENGFPVIALFPGHVDESLVPPGIATRLHISTSDRDWKERIIAAAEKRPHVASRPEILPYHLRLHTPEFGDGVIIEVRPRAGVWAPFQAKLPITEYAELNPRFTIGPRDKLPQQNYPMQGVYRGESEDGEWWCMSALNQCTTTESYFIACNKLPSALIFGTKNGEPQYNVTEFNW